MTDHDLTTPGPRELQWHDEPRPIWLAKSRADLEGRVVLRRRQVQHGSGHNIGILVGGVVMDPDATTSKPWIWWHNRHGRHNGDSGYAETREAALAELEAAVAQRGWVIRGGRPAGVGCNRRLDAAKADETRAEDLS